MTGLGSNPGFTSNKTTHHLLDYGDEDTKLIFPHKKKSLLKLLYNDLHRWLKNWVRNWIWALRRLARHWTVHTVYLTRPTYFKRRFFAIEQAARMIETRNSFELVYMCGQSSINLTVGYHLFHPKARGTDGFFYFFSFLFFVESSK